MELCKNFDDLPRDGTPVIVFVNEQGSPLSYCEELRWGTSEDGSSNQWFTLCYSEDRYEDEDLEEIFIGFIIHPFKKQIMKKAL